MSKNDKDKAKKVVINEPRELEGEALIIAIVADQIYGAIWAAQSSGALSMEATRQLVINVIVRLLHADANFDADEKLLQLIENILHIWKSDPALKASIEMLRGDGHGPAH